MITVNFNQINGDNHSVRLIKDDTTIIYHARKIFPNAWTLIHNNLELSQNKIMKDFDIDSLNITVISSIPKLILTNNLSFINHRGDFYICYENYNEKCSENIREIFELSDYLYLLLSFDNILYKYNSKIKKIDLLATNINKLFWINKYLNFIFIEDNIFTCIDYYDNKSRNRNICDDFNINKDKIILNSDYKIFTNDNELILATNDNLYIKMNGNCIIKKYDFKSGINIDDIKSIHVIVYGLAILTKNGNVLFNIDDDCDNDSLLSLKQNNVILNDIIKIYSHFDIFIMLKKNNSLISLGEHNDEYNKILENYKNVIDMYNCAYCHILINSNKTYELLYCHFSSISMFNIFENNSKIKKIVKYENTYDCPANYCISILFEDNKVITLGDTLISTFGYKYSNIQFSNNLILTNIKDIYATSEYFIGITFDNNYITWKINNWIIQRHFEDIQFIHHSCYSKYFILFKYNGDMILSDGQTYNNPINIFSIK